MEEQQDPRIVRGDCIKQGSHGDWKTGKTGKMIMVREKSGKSQGTNKNDQKSGNFGKSQGILQM